MFKKNDRVENARFGKGTIIEVDTKTYSITMVYVKLDSGEKVYRSASEWRPILEQVYLYDLGHSIPGRRLTSTELANLPTDWENPTVDTDKYFQCVHIAWEVAETEYELWKETGGLCQKHGNKFYVAHCMNRSPSLRKHVRLL